MTAATAQPLPEPGHGRALDGPNPPGAGASNSAPSAPNAPNAASAAGAHQAAASAARQAYGRLLAWLAWQWRDLAAAEDALASALEAALTEWPTHGVPDAPQAWLLTVARRTLLQAARRQRLHDSPQVQALLDAEPTSTDNTGSTDDTHIANTSTSLPDSRLKLLFVCAHPALDAAVRPALMLQVVLGLQARQIAPAMLTSPAALAQRLVRAKHKIRAAGLRFEEPDEDALPTRLHAVLEAIYAAYGLGWDHAEADPDADPATAADPELQGLRSEALFLADLVCTLLPASAQRAEAEGLLALMLFCEARHPARRAADGSFVPLDQQDSSTWQRPLIEQGNQLLHGAARWCTPGPFQLEAAIQSAHCQRLFGGHTPWAGIVSLYERMLALAPSLGAQVAHAVACAQAGDSARAAGLLAGLQSPRLVAYQPYWVALGHVANQQGQVDAARQAWQRAIGLTSAPALRAHLLARLHSLA